MSVYITWLTATDTNLSVALRHEEMADGNTVSSPAAICIDGDEPVIIEGRRGTLYAMVSKLAKDLVPDEHAHLELLVRKARAAAGGGSSDDEIEKLQNALEKALWLLGVREQPEPVTKTWHVQSNVTGARESKDFDTLAKAEMMCAALNNPTSGGRYGVYDSNGERA